MQRHGTLAEHSAIPDLAWIGALICAVAMLFMILPSFARDNGQWGDSIQ